MKTTESYITQIMESLLLSISAIQLGEYKK